MSNDRVKLTAEQRTALETGRCHFTHVIERLVNLGLATHVSAGRIKTTARGLAALERA